MEVAIKIVRTILSIIALGSVIRLGIREAELGVQISLRVYIILAGVVFGLSGDDVVDLIKKFKK